MMLEVDDLLIGEDQNRIDGFLKIVVQRQTRLTEDVCGCGYSRSHGRASYRYRHEFG